MQRTRYYVHHPKTNKRENLFSVWTHNLRLHGQEWWPLFSGYRSLCLLHVSTLATVHLCRYVSTLITVHLYKYNFLHTSVFCYNSVSSLLELACLMCSLSVTFVSVGLRQQDVFLGQCRLVFLGNSTLSQVFNWQKQETQPNVSCTKLAEFGNDWSLYTCDLPWPWQYSWLCCLYIVDARATHTLHIKDGCHQFPFIPCWPGLPARAFGSWLCEGILMELKHLNWNLIWMTFYPEVP